MKKKRIVVVCPGRGSYTKETLGYLKQYGSHVKDFIVDIDERRRSVKEPTITELDSAEAFKPNLHTKGEHASSLIYACAYADFMAIDRDKYEVVAVTGNSMGWYLTLAFAGSLDWAGGFEVVNTMGSMMKDGTVGGQVIYPISDAHWVKSPEKRALVEKVVADVGSRDGHEVYISIELGGYLVMGGNKPALAALLKELPKVDDYPFQLINHAAFHTPILSGTSARAFEVIPMNLFNAPQIPMIDGRGAIWQPYSTHIQELYQYTLGHQVVQIYDFTRAISVALKEFTPDHLVLLGPGGSLGGSIGQIMVENNWNGVKSKEDFTKSQSEKSDLISMGRAEQRQMITK
jgi:acyl transferase domain-containing protein